MIYIPTHLFQLFRSLAPLTFRYFHTSPSHLGIFSPSSASTPPSPQPDDHPLTPFQTRIAALETEAHAHPESSDTQLALLRELLTGGEFQGLAKYYEAVALSEAEDGRSQALLTSEEAWGMFVESLGRTGKLSEVAGMVRRRDRLLAGVATTPAPSPGQTQSLLTTQSTPFGTAAEASSSTPTPSSPPPSLSGLLSSVVAGSASSSSGAIATASSSTPGSPLSPIYVQMAPPTTQINAWKAIRWLLGVCIWAFIVLTILSMVMENTGLLKAGPGPMEFEPEEGKVVKFSDVHGVEEAKSVRLSPPLVEISVLRLMVTIGARRDR